MPIRHWCSIVQPWMTAAWPIVTLSPIVVSCVPVMACTTAPSWTFVRRPTRITFTSPRTTAHIQTLLSSPISTSPMICALSSMNAVGWTRGAVPRYGRSIQRIIPSENGWPAGSRSRTVCRMTPTRPTLRRCASSTRPTYDPCRLRTCSGSSGCWQPTSSALCPTAR